MFPFPKRNEEIEFHKEQNAIDRKQNKETETFKMTAQDDQTALNMQEERTDLLKWQQDMEPELAKLIMTLKGFQQSEGTWSPRTYWKDGKFVKAVPMCNDQFISEVVIPQCTPFLDRNIINTWYEEAEILNNLRNTCDDIVDAMCDHYDAYGIEFTNNDIIMRNIKNVIKPGAFRALRGWTKKIDSTIIRRVEQSSDSPEKDKKGILGVFKT